LASNRVNTTNGNGGKTRIPRKKKTAGRTSDTSLEKALALFDVSACTGEGQLTEDELLHRCESLINEKVARVMAAGIAFAIIQKNRLWKRYGCKCFSDYIEQKLNHRRSYVYFLIAAAKVLCNVHNCGQFTVLPANEGQARQLTMLTAEEQIVVWGRIVESTPPDKITAKVVAKHVLDYVEEQAIQTPDEPGVGQAGPTETDHEEEGGEGSVPVDNGDDAGERADDAESVQENSSDNDQNADAIELTNRSAEEGNPVALIFNAMADHRPHPHPTRWNVSRKRLLAAYVFQTDLPVEQRKRLWEVTRTDTKEACVTRGMEALTQAFSTLTRTPLIAKCRGQNGMYQITELWLAAANATRVTE
jgi:hypothetical protein